MIEARLLNATNVGLLERLYMRFGEKAREDYSWAHDPVPFRYVVDALSKGALEGLILLSGSDSRVPLGFMLYRYEAHRAIEVNVIYLQGVPDKTALNVLMPVFLDRILQRGDWDVISYAMLGRQADYVLSMTWFGFMPVGQAIVKFDFLNSLAVQIMHKQVFPPLPDDYNIVPWNDMYTPVLANTIHHAFHTAADALWDPRFKTLQGCQSIVELLRSGMMGEIIPQGSSIAICGDKLVGFCFVIQSDPLSANIPLVGVIPTEQGKKIGCHLLKRTLSRMIEMALRGETNLFSIDATTDTDNFSALHMYRRMGFREQEHYPHLYLTREKAMAYKRGKWC